MRRVQEKSIKALSQDISVIEDGSASTVHTFADVVPPATANEPTIEPSEVDASDPSTETAAGVLQVTCSRR